MHAGRTVLAQLMDLVPKHEFDKCVRRYGGDKHVRRLSCYGQFLAMCFAQLTGRDSLRDIEICLRAVGRKLYMPACAARPREAPWPTPTRSGIGAFSPTSRRS